MSGTTVRKKLIEVALPLEAINVAAAKEKQPGIGAHPRGMHLWWARRPLAAARAVIFAQMVDDPSANPDLFPTEKKQEKERQRLFKIIEDLVQWENTTNEEVLGRARDEIWQSWRRACAQNADHPRARELFDRNKLPGFHDPFAGGGALPLEAQRLGLEAHASDLNPVAVLINKAMIEIPPRFAGRPPVHPGAQTGQWHGAQGLAEDVRYYGQWMRDEAEKRIGKLYPKIKVTADMAKSRADLKDLVGQELTVIAWLWARTVKSPNPAFANVDVPLASTFMLSTKPGKEAYVHPEIEGAGYRFTVKVGTPKDAEATKLGTTAGKRAAFRCLMSGVPITYDHIRSEGKAGRMGAELMAIVAEGSRGRVYLPPTEEHEAIAREAKPTWTPDMPLPDNPRDFKTPNYGLTTYADLFTPRQLVALTTLSDLVAGAITEVRAEAELFQVLGTKRLSSSDPWNITDDRPLRDGGMGARAYAEAIATYLAFAIDRLADYNSSIATWKPSGEQVMQTYKRQALPMTWDFPESNVLGQSAICWKNAVKYTADNLEIAAEVTTTPGFAVQADASSQTLSRSRAVSTDPPYYDNIGYADLSDFFYAWLRRSLRSVYPDIFATVTVPKVQELVASPYRHGGVAAAQSFFLDGMTQAMHRLAEQAHSAFPVTIYYAFKQSESSDEGGTTNTGWDTFLAAVIEAGFAITGTWPMRTELANRMIGCGTNALASSIVLVCRPRASGQRTVTRRDFIAALKIEMPEALRLLQAGNIAPVDLAQASIGPGMAVFTRYNRILESDGSSMTVRTALLLINQTLDEVLAEQEGDFDPETAWAVAWFAQFGFSEGPFGDAETLSKAKNTALNALVDAGVVKTGAGKTRLLRVDELPSAWDPARDKRLTIWEMVHHLIRVMNAGGESAAAALVAKLGPTADTARELAYRLYHVSERRKRAQEALGYNALVQSWPELVRLSRETSVRRIAEQGELL